MDMSFVDASGKTIPPMPIGTPKPNKLHLKPETTYFFKKSNGAYIATDDSAAWRILNGQNQTIGRQPEGWEYVGRTDGVNYVKKVNASFHLLLEGKLEEYQAALLKAEKEEYRMAKKDKTWPRNRDIVNTSGLPNSEIMR